MLVGCCVQLVITWKMLWSAPKTFINAIFSALTMTKSLVLPILVCHILELGTGFLNEDISSPDTVLNNCGMFLITITTINNIDFFYNFGIIFCRFVYTRYAYGLTVSTVKVFHFLVCSIIGAFTAQFFIVELMKYDEAVKNNEFPFNTMDGFFCSGLAVDSNFQPDTKEFQKVSLVLIAFVALAALSNFLIQKACSNVCCFHHIPSRRINFLTLKDQGLYFNLLITFIFLDRLVNFLLLLLFDTLGQKMIFQLWWSYQIIYLIVINIVAQMLILFRIVEKDEYNGLRARRYPNQPKVRRMTPEPRRDVLEEVHQQLANSPYIDDMKDEEKKQRMFWLRKKKLGAKSKSTKKLQMISRFGERLETVIEMPEVYIS